LQQLLELIAEREWLEDPASARPPVGGAAEMEQILSGHTTMSDMTRILAMYLLLLSCLSCSKPKPETVTPETITYRGEQIPISKVYGSYEEYKDDPKNLPKEQVARIEHLLLSAPVPDRCNSFAELVQATGKIQFPGYGLSQMATPQKDGTSVIMVQIEIPHRNCDRVLVYHAQGNTHVLLDDFVSPEDDTPVHVVLDGEQLQFLDSQQKVVLRRPIKRPSKTQGGG
jgi:hypothetical protein